VVVSKDRPAVEVNIRGKIRRPLYEGINDGGGIRGLGTTHEVQIDVHSERKEKISSD
jgi:hypothetical protein